MYSLLHKTYFETTKDGEMGTIGGQYPTPNLIKYFVQEWCQNYFVQGLRWSGRWHQYWE